MTVAFTVMCAENTVIGTRMRALYGEARTTQEAAAQGEARDQKQNVVWLSLQAPQLRLLQQSRKPADT